MTTSTPHSGSAHSASVGVYRGLLHELFETQAGLGSNSFRERLASLLAHPDDALPVPTAKDRSVWGPGGSADEPTAASIVRRALRDREMPWPVPLATQAARVHQDGERNGWEQIVFERQRRLSRAVVAAATTLDPVWLGEVLDGVWLLCEQTSWCWPAHDDAFRERGEALASVSAPFLDLGAGEVVGQLAWIDHLLGRPLEERYPGIRARVRHEARDRIFRPFLNRRDWHWLGLNGPVNNWNPWIHGNVLVAALRLLDNPEDEADRLETVALVIEGIDRYVSTLPPDGAIDEGYSYWWNGACRALEALEILRHATGGVLDASSVPALRQTVAFPHRMQLGGHWYVNLADGQARPPASQPWHALHRAARAIGDIDAAAFATSHRVAGAAVATEAEGLGRLLQGITDRDWVEAGQTEPPLPRDVWLPSTQVLLARQHGGSALGLTLAVKGGHNGESHNHNDVGSFVVASDGVPVIVDAGRPTYTLQTFGPRRYEIWSMRSGWHNVPLVNGHEQAVGAAFSARDVEASISDRTSMHLDLAGAYSDAGIRLWRRVASLDREAHRVEIRDSWEWDEESKVEAGAPTEVRMLLAGIVHLSQDHATVTPLDGATWVRISWPSGIAARLVTTQLSDPMLSDVWGPELTRLDLDVTTCREIVVVIEPASGARPR